ncbi:MAG: antibiotic biosynthesis monooxygenase [Catenulispora sp.]|nr:antibiotic biosynthesis monooxygenase [Catenulispora sp.]
MTDSPAPTIAVGRPIATLINVFTTTPETQADVVEAWATMTESTMQHQPGFISASVHASDDGLRVVNYAQWESTEHFQALFGVPEVMEVFERLGTMAQMDPRLYTVKSVHHSA